MNEEIKKAEISEEELESVSGGEANEVNRGYTCQFCGSDKIRVLENAGKMGYFCFDCRRGAEL